MRIIYTISFLLVASLLFLGNAGGPGEFQSLDRTGSPVASGFCMACHNNGAFNPSMTLEVLEGDNLVTSYQPGTSYTMRVTVNADAGAQIYGFQAVALLGGDLQAGSFTAGSGTQVTPLNNREYIEHSQASTDNVFEVEWTAPANSSGDVSFYAAAIAGNNNGSSGGDGAALLNSPVVLSEGTVNTQTLPALASSLTVYPNPVGDMLNIQLELDENTQANVRIYNQPGQQLALYQERLTQGENQLFYDVSELPSGHYVLEISSGDKVSVSQMIKQ